MEKQPFSDEQFDKIFAEQSAEINKQLDQEILIAMIGDVNAGKSSTINRLMDGEVARVGAKPGETVSIEKYALQTVTEESWNGYTNTRQETLRQNSL